MKNIKELGLELIQLEDQVLLVDNNQKIGVGDFYINNVLLRCTSTIDIMGVEGMCKKVICSTKPLGGLPLLVIEDEGVVLSKEAYKKHSVKDHTLSLDEQIQRTGGFNVGYKEGFDKAKSIYKFTEEDMVEFAMNMISQYQFGNTNIHNKDILMESLSKKELWVEVEYDHDDTVPYPKTKGTGHALKITNNQIIGKWK